MSRKIFPLDEVSIRKIAAGEVVERPASVVKELLENSLDAGARRIDLDIQEGGRARIRVSDDGCGMSREDALLSLERHTTSKIRSSDDLERLGTFGFRGEALPSIASVARFELQTRAAEEPLGTHLLMEGGKLAFQKDCGRSVGTTIEVRDLFFNTPARLKFMKSESSEKGRIVRTFEETAMAHPEVSFSLGGEARSRTELTARKDPFLRLTDLWGEDFAEGALASLGFEHPFLRLRGWVSTPEAHRPTKNYQIFYVNQRPVQSRLLAHAFYEAYRDCLPVGRHPACVLFLEMDPSQVDVNVHPAKREVRFRSEPQIYESVVREVRARRSQQSGPPSLFFPASPVPVPEGLPAAAPTLRENPVPYGTSDRLERAPANISPNFPAGARAFQETIALSERPRVLAQFQKLYILAEQGDALLIVDQHAAAERILYEEFRRALLENHPVPTQALLIPLIWKVPPAQADLLSAQSPRFEKLGFRIEPFGAQTFRLTECPAQVSESEVRGVLDEILGELEKEKDPSLVVEEKIMHGACRAAIKANDSLSNAELAELLRALALCSNPHTCPHGRPITLRMTRAELDKKFGRT